MPLQPGIALGPAEEVLGRRIGVFRNSRSHEPAFRRHTVPEVQRFSHFAHRLLAQRDRVCIGTVE